ncbi:MAG: branched-chain amino acid ABC transporter permease [Oscillospiraceae bacterium]|nr:branched-chain amino acid ABC transporter permease [Oscillospiraceae bacterium]
MSKLMKHKKYFIYLVFLATLIPLFLDTAYSVLLVTSIAIYGLMAIGFNLLLGYTGIAVMGYGIYFGAGAYAIAIGTVRFGLSFGTSFAIAIVVCILISCLISLLALRVKLIFFSIATMAMGQLFFVMILRMRELTHGDDGIPGVESIFPDRIVFACVAVFLLVLAFFFSRMVVNSNTGRVMQAMRSNEDRVSMLGYNVFAYKFLVIQISGIIAGIAGVLYVMFLSVAHPGMANTLVALQAIFMTILGGAGTLAGPVIGAALMRLMESVLSAFTARWMLIMGVIFILIVLFSPAGVMGFYYKLKYKIQARFRKGGTPDK